MVTNTLCKGLRVHWVEGRDGRIDSRAGKQTEGWVDR